MYRLGFLDFASPDGPKGMLAFKALHTTDGLLGKQG